MPETRKKLIDGETFEITAPYAEGHTINAAEAKVLNQTRSENIGNNVRARIKELKAANKIDEARELVAKIDSEYVFTLSNVGEGRKSLDPIEREARNIAKDIIKAHLAKTGRKITVAPDGETKDSWADKIEAQIEQLTTRADVVKLAKENVGKRQKVIDAGLGDLEG